jgi:hypothetical protein
MKCPQLQDIFHGHDYPSRCLDQHEGQPWMLAEVQLLSLRIYATEARVIITTLTIVLNQLRLNTCYKWSIHQISIVLSPRVEKTDRSLPPRGPLALVSLCSLG